MHCSYPCSNRCNCLRRRERERIEEGEEIPPCWIEATRDKTRRGRSQPQQSQILPKLPSTQERERDMPSPPLPYLSRKKEARGKKGGESRGVVVWGWDRPLKTSFFRDPAYRRAKGEGATRAHSLRQAGPGYPHKWIRRRRKGRGENFFCKIKVSFFVSAKKRSRDILDEDEDDLSPSSLPHFSRLHSTWDLKTGFRDVGNETFFCTLERFLPPLPR